MFCATCGSEIPDVDHNFCSNCGSAITDMAEVEANLESEDEDNFDEENIIEYYFRRGFSYEEIILFLHDRHVYKISYITLLRRLKAYNLSRRGFGGKENALTIIEQVRQRIVEILAGPGTSGGYRTVWHTLEMEGLRVPRVIVQDMLKELDPEGAERRKPRRLKRRCYRNPGPNFAWHIDGYDKLKPWGFPIHGGIDGFSRKMLWLNVTRSNNSPDNIASFYLNAVRELKGCPMQLVTDLGTENGLAASIQSYLHDDPESHRYVALTRNQRIEGWWSFLAKNRTVWWRNLFKDLESEGTIDSSSELSMECLWFCFSFVLQEDLNSVKEAWNTHVIRKSGHDTVAGRPDSLFFLPEHHGARADMLMGVSSVEISYIAEHIIENNTANEYQEYFEYARCALHIDPPQTWQEAYQLYHILMDTAQNGTLEAH